jgi:hypothetical protein
MSDIDPTVASVLNSKRVDSDDEDALIAALEADEHDAELVTLRERRRDQLHEEFTLAKSLRSEGAGVYTELKDEKQVLDQTTSAPRVVVHFYKNDFARCAVMDTHLEVSPILSLCSSQSLCITPVTQKERGKESAVDCQGIVFLLFHLYKASFSQYPLLFLYVVIAYASKEKFHKSSLGEVIHLSTAICINQ